MTVLVARSLEEMCDLRDDWSALARKSRNPLQDLDWHIACARCLHRTDRIHVVVQKDAAGGITAIAPLVLNRRNRLEFLGAHYLFEPCDILYQDNDAFQSVVASLSDFGFPLLLSRVPREHESTGATQYPFGRSGHWLTSPAAGAPVLDLAMPWTTFYDSLSSKRRYDLRRAKKRAASMGDISFVALRPACEDVASFLQLAYGIENRSWKGRSGSSLRKNALLGNFFREYAERAATQGILRVFFLNIAEEGAAMAICVEKYNALWFLKIGYDERFSRCSPGILQVMNIVKHCCETGISRIEHLGTYEPWLDPWTSRVRPHISVRHYPYSPAGLWALGNDLVDRLSGRIFRSMKALRNRSV